MRNDDQEELRPETGEKTLAFTSAERGFVARLAELAVAAQAQRDAVSALTTQVIAETRQRLGLPESARLRPDLERGGFVVQNGECLVLGSRTTPGETRPRYFAYDSAAT